MAVEYRTGRFDLKDPKVIEAEITLAKCVSEAVDLLGPDLGLPVKSANVNSPKEDQHGNHTGEFTVWLETAFSFDLNEVIAGKYEGTDKLVRKRLLAAGLELVEKLDRTANSLRVCLPSRLGD